MQKRSFLVVTMFLIGMFLTGMYAQTITVTGSVIDKEMGDPLIGVNVLVKGTTNGTVTDMDGHYSLTVNPNDVLVFSYNQYEDGRRNGKWKKNNQCYHGFGCRKFR